MDNLLIFILQINCAFLDPTGSTPALLFTQLMSLSMHHKAPRPECASDLPIPMRAQLLLGLEEVRERACRLWFSHLSQSHI